MIRRPIEPLKMLFVLQGSYFKRLIVPQVLLFIFSFLTPLSTLYNSLILKGLKFNNFLAKNCKPSIYRALEKRVESQVMRIIS